MATPHRTVGARELKTRLGTYLRRVREGATLVVTERGRPIAELRPIEPAGTTLEDRLKAMISAGLLTQEAPSPGPLAPFVPLVNRGRPLAEAVAEDREDRF